MSAAGTARRSTLAVALAATVAAAGWVGSQEEPAASESRPQQRAAAPAATAAPAARAVSDDIDVEKLQKRTMEEEFVDMFPRRSWQPPPVPASARKREPPSAPPLPFAFFGRMVEEGQTVVFLSRQNQSFAVKAGDTIDNAYRVEEIGAAVMVLTYLPLGQRQMLQIGSIN